MTAIHSLGKPVRIYEGHRRSSILLATCASAAGAALAGWLASLLDGRLWIFIPGAAAVGLSLLTLNLLLVLLQPGKRIGVYEYGLTVGNRSVRWDELNHVSIGRVGITDEQSGAIHEEVDVNLHLDSGETLALFLSDDTLPFHIDVTELAALLTSRGVKVRDELADTEHREDAATGVNRNPEVAAELRQAFRKALDRAMADGDATPVLTAIAAGNRDRRRQRLQYLLLSLSFKGLEAIVLLLAFVLGLTLGALALLALIEIVALINPGNGNEDVLGGLGLPIGLYRLPLLMVAMPLIVLAMQRCGQFAEPLGARARRDRARSRAMREPASITEETLTAPFTVYLRSFAGEYFRYLETTADRGQGGLAKKYATLERELDLTLIGAMRDCMPLLALANSRDASAPAELDTMFVPADQWIDVATILMVRARAVVLNLSFATESLLAELWALEQLGAQSRTFIVIGTKFPVDGLDAEDHQRLERFPNRAPDDASDLAGKLEVFVGKIAE